jgi:multiple sugar transport system ATP-binding protein
MATLTFNDACKCYAGQTDNAVNDLNLEVADGEFVAFVGPSGCGKSTALRMAAGLEEISSGEIQIGGRVVNGVASKDRDVAMVFQSYALYPHMTIYDNLAFGLKQRKTPKADIDQRVRKVAASLGLADYLKRKPGQLSGGQRQRVALGRAIVREPQVFLMDEPLSNLDAQLRVQTRLEILKLHRELGTTFVYVTHDQIEAMTMGDRIVVLRDGVLQQVDTPQTLYEHPVNQFVAGFIGSPAMSFVAAVLSTADGQPALRGEGFELPLPEELLSRFDVGPEQAVVLGIRPEYLRDGRYADIGAVTIPATVDLVEIPGSDVFAHLTVGGAPLTARMDMRSADLQQGQTLEAAVDLEHIQMFDPETQLSLATRAELPVSV